MQFLLKSIDHLNIEPIMTVQHGDQSHTWNINTFGVKPNFQKDDMYKHMFAHTNRYWATLPEHDQQAIFNVFVEMRNCVDTHPSTPVLTEQLQALLKRLYDLHKFEHMETWVTLSKDIHLPGPDFLETEFVENEDKNHTRNKTYTVSDYVKLVTLILQLRLMVPIWGEYVEITQSTFSTLFKEFFSLQLLNDTSVMASEPMQKLFRYVEERVPEEGNKTAIHSFVSSLEYPTWITAYLVVRRLCLADIRGEVDKTAVLVRHISRHVHERVKRTDNSFGGVIKPKTDSNLKGSEENQISLVEGFKIKQSITEGNIGTMRFYVSDAWKVARQLKADITEKEFGDAMKTWKTIKDYDFKAPQILLLQWMIDIVIPARGVDFLDNHTIARLLCVCQAVLWAEGHYFLAALATSMEHNVTGAAVFSETSTKGRLTKDVTDDIHATFPYQKTSRSGKIQMEPIKSIDIMTEEFGSFAWNMTLSDKLIAEINPRNPTSKRLLLPHNFRTMVAMFGVYIAKRPRTLNLPQPL